MGLIYDKSCALASRFVAGAATMNGAQGSYEPDPSSDGSKPVWKCGVRVVYDLHAANTVARVVTP